jgi:hypothetical protein
VSERQELGGRQAEPNWQKSCSFEKRRRKKKKEKNKKPKENKAKLSFPLTSVILLD